MKTVILCGGRGTRISEETEMIPKPMVEIGGKPILWHIMKTYSRYGFNDFVICLGYRGYLIKEYFSHYFLHMSDVTIDLEENKTVIHNTTSEPWKITLVDTGLETLTGGRLKRIAQFVGDESFMLTYGDGLADIDIDKLLKFHRKHKVLATVTSVQPSGRFGLMDLDKSGKVKTFLEKPRGDNAWLNGGFFVLEPKVLSFISGDDIAWEKEPLEALARAGQLAAYQHEGFWKPMDTLRDKIELEKLWQSGKAPWKVWK
ncbi:MAG TPA: glucose-1-phosphate cytidylyltransferase [Candidatus Omnitrophica bacterium]|nr:glucose-1-phosphate cytidylyltransferase [Candidatus Omnitrophota bacterium]